MVSRSETMDLGMSYDLINSLKYNSATCMALLVLLQGIWKTYPP